MKLFQKFGQHSNPWIFWSALNNFACKFEPLVLVLGGTVFPLVVAFQRSKLAKRRRVGHMSAGQTDRDRRRRNRKGNRLVTVTCAVEESLFQAPQKMLRFCAVNKDLRWSSELLQLRGVICSWRKFQVTNNAIESIKKCMWPWQRSF